MKSKSTRRALLLAASSTLLAFSSAHAQNGTWLGNGNAWDDPAAWSGGTIATGAFTANFIGVDLTSDVTMALGVNRSINNIVFTDDVSSSHNLTLTGNTLSLNGTVNVTQPDRNLTISSILGGSGTFSKIGQGTLTLTGANTLTGSSSINNGGTLVLDYSSQNNRKLTTGALTLNGGTIVMKGGSATESVTSTTLGGNTLGTFFVRDGGTTKINLNNTTVSGNQSIVSFSHDSMATTDRTNVAGILGAWFTVGNRWAANSTGVADGDIVGYTGGTTFNPAAAVNQDVNYDLAGGGTLTATRFVNTLRIESTANDQVLNLGANSLQTSNFTGTNALAGTSGGLLYAGGANGNYTITDNGSTGRVIIENGNGQAQLINVYSGTLTVNAIIGAGSSAFVKSGEGTLVFNKANGYTGATRVYQGVLRVTGAGTLTAGTTVQNGSAIELGNSVAIASSATLNITGTGVSNGGALRSVAATTSSYAGAITIGGGGARINSDSGTLTLSGGIVTAGNTVTFGGAGNINVSTGIIAGAGGLVKDGAGTTTLTSGNTYAGATTISAGKLVIDGNNSAATGIISVANLATLGGGGTVGGATTINAGGIVSPGNSIGTLSFSGNLTIDGTYLVETASVGLSDLLDVNGILSLGTASVLDLDSLSSLVATETYVIADYTGGSLSGFFSSVDSSITTTHSVAYDYNSGTQIALVPIPEPSTLVLGGLALLGFAGAGLRKRRLVK